MPVSSKLGKGLLGKAARKDSTEQRALQGARRRLVSQLCDRVLRPGDLLASVAVSGT